jgi:hypothetical protein
MLKLVDGAINLAGTPGSGDAEPTALLRTMPLERMDPEAMLVLALAHPGVDEATRIIIASYETAATFARKLADFYTHLYPCASAFHEGLLCEVLDVATTGYLKAERFREPRDQMAAFLANAICAATRLHLAYSAFQQRGSCLERWEPWERGPLSAWAAWGRPVEFVANAMPSAERLFATRSMLAQRLLRFTDVVTIAKAGIDLHALDLF